MRCILITFFSDIFQAETSHAAVIRKHFELLDLLSSYVLIATVAGSVIFVMC